MGQFNSTNHHHGQKYDSESVLTVYGVLFMGVEENLVDFRFARLTSSLIEKKKHLDNIMEFLVV